jgi:branched-chain amino acid transport system substrate-binding protein
MRDWRILVAVFAAILAVLVVAIRSKSSPGSDPSVIRIGAVFPLSGPAASQGKEEFDSFRLAADFVNASGGIHGRRIVFDERDVPTSEQVASAVASLAADRVALIVGGYSSDISIPAAYDSAQAHLVYWEAGAEADQVTGQGLPTVFRVGATGSQLGDNSARFLVTQLVPRMHTSPPAIRASLVTAEDSYATSVSDAVMANLRANHVPIVSVSRYDAYRPDWEPILARLRAAHPDVVFLTSHVADGMAFRRAFLAAHLNARVFIGTTMAQCTPGFASLGQAAVGVFASDRPGGDGFDPQDLPPSGRALYNRLAGAWTRLYHRTPHDEEALSGFSAGWVLFHYVLPMVRGDLATPAIAAAARRVDLPRGALPNGAGVRFATSGDMVGQNLRASAVIWQWQSPGHYAVVWPAAYADGHILMTIHFGPRPAQSTWS